MNIKRSIALVLVLIMCLPLCAYSETTSSIDWKQCEGQEITFATYVGWEADYIDNSLSEFYDLTGITVTVEQYPEDQLYQKVQLDTISGTGTIDAFTMDMMRIPEFAGSGYLANIQEYLDNPALTDAEAYDVNDILAGPLGAAQYNGVQFGIPWTAETNLLFYRKDIFNELNLNVPKTFEDLTACCQAIKEAHPEMAAIALRGQRGSGMNIYTWTQFFRGFGGDFFVDFPNDMNPTLNSEQAIASTEYYAELSNKYGPSDGANWTNIEVYTGMQTGTVAMTMDANAFANTIESDASSTKGLWGYDIVPGGEGGVWPAIYSHIMCMNNFGENKDATWLFMLWCTGKDMVTRRGKESGVPIRASAWNSDEVRSALYYMGEGTYVDKVLESLAMGDAQYRPIFPHWNEVGDLLGIAVQNVIAGGSDAKTALDKAQSDIITVLKENNYIK